MPWSDLQNAASRTVFASFSPTTVMTGNVTQLIIDAVDLAGGATVDASAAIRARMRRFWPPVVSFAGGAVAGAVGFSKFGFGALTLPTALVNRHATVGQPMSRLSNCRHSF